MQLRQRLAQQRVVGRLRRVEAGEDHRFGTAIAGQRRRRPLRPRRDRVAHANVAHVLQPRRHVAHLARREARQRRQLRPEGAELHRLEAPPRRQQPQRRLALQRPVHDPQVGDRPLVGVVLGVEDQRPQRRLHCAGRRRHPLYDRLQQPLDPLTRLGGDEQQLLLREANRVHEFAPHLLRPRHLQVDLVDHRDHREILAQRQVDVGQRLRLDARRRVDHQERALRRRQAARNLVAEVHVPRRVDQVELVAGPGDRVRHPHRPCLDRDPLLPLQLHGIQQLRRHLPRLHRAGDLQQPVRQRRLAVIDVGDDAEVANAIAIHGVSIVSRSRPAPEPPLPA